MELAFVTSTDLHGLSNAKSRRQIRQHASREMWKNRRSRPSVDPGGELPVRPGWWTPHGVNESSGPEFRAHPSAAQPQKAGRLASTGLLTPISPISDRAEDRDQSTDDFRYVFPSRLGTMLGTGRLDPFTRYPIEMKPLEQRIIHHGQSATRLHESHSLIADVTV